jgi:RNA polymerase sigma factor (sigma-70 family)
MSVSQRARDPEVSEELWRVHRDELLRFATTLVGPHDAYDVVTDAFVRCVKNIDRVPVENRRAYLHRAVANEAVSHHRSCGRRWRRDLAGIVSDVVPAEDSFADVRTALMELSVQQRAVVYFVYWQDAQLPQVATTLGMSLRTARQHLDRAHVKLRKALHGQ